MKKTNFYICRNDTVHVIQSSFSHFRPGFEINFFSNIENKQSRNSCVMFSSDVRIRDINPECLDGCIELNDTMTAIEMENLILDNFNLHAQISPGTVRQPASNFLTQGVRIPEIRHSFYFKNIPFGR